VVCVNKKTDGWHE